MLFFGVVFESSNALPKAEFCTTLSSTVMTVVSLAPELVEGWCIDEAVEWNDELVDTGI